MMFDIKTGFTVIDKGSEYRLPLYEVQDGIGIRPIDDSLTVKIVTGSRLPSDNIERNQGTLHEHLLEMMIYDLEFKNSKVPCEETEQTILKLKEALMWLRQRSINRQIKSVIGTYEKH